MKDRTVTVVGDRKMVVFDDVHPTEKLRIYDKGVTYQPGGEASPSSSLPCGTATS